MHDGDVLTAASVLDRPPGFVKSTSQASISRDIRSVNPNRCMLSKRPNSALQNGLQFRVVAADHEDLGTFSAARLSHESGRPNCRTPMLPEATRNHFAVISAPAARRPPHATLASLFAMRSREGPAYRNPERKEPFSSQSLLTHSSTPVFVRDDIIIQIGLPRKGDTYSPS